jgi:DNA (cytosine-5)-methyltransferase 1
MRTVAFCEIDPYCRAVLRKHWPDVPVFDDVRTLTAEVLADAAGKGLFSRPCSGIHCGQEGAGPRNAQSERRGIDLICGGFPCQDISVAGKGAGLKGERSGLWKEFARIIGELRPRYVIVENVAALLGRGLGDVLGDLAALGYDAEWHCIPASAVGAPHRRDRIWIVAYPGCINRDGRSGECGGPETAGTRDWSARSGQHALDVAYPSRPDVEGQRLASRIQAERSAFGGASWWLTEPDVGRVANGVPARMDRLKGLGNAVVPQIPEIIGKAIMKAEHEFLS